MWEVVALGVAGMYVELVCKVSVGGWCAGLVCTKGWRGSGGWVCGSSVGG